MKHIFTQKIFCLALLATVIAPSAHAQFTTGNIVVLQVGNGGTLISGVAAPLYLREFNTTTAGQTTAVSTVAIPSTNVAGRLTNSGSATSEGQITLSSDSTKLVIAGYDADSGYVSVASSTSILVPRGIDTVGKSGIVGRADTTQTAFSGNNIRSATRNGGENYWAAGGTTGTYYMGNLAAPTIIQSVTATNTRVILAANGKLYFTSSSGTPRLLRINSQPTTAAAADTLIVLGAGASPYGFAINSGESVVYIADDRTTTSGGIQKWTLSGTTWSLAYTLSVGVGARSVIADWSTTNPTLYAVTTVAGGSLVKIVDSNATATALTLATGTATSTIRSVAFVPRAVVTCTPATLLTTVTPYTCNAAGTITLSATGGTGPFTFAYTGPGSFTASTQNLTNLQPGTYNVTVSGGGCSATTSATVANNASITATAAATGSTTRCQKDSVLLTANGGTGYRYQWKLNGTPLTADTLQTYKAGATGSYTVTVSSGINCTATSPAVAITVNPLPATTITPGGSTTFCSGGSVSLCAPAAAGYTYQFRQGFTNISAATTQCYTATASGTYKVFVTTSLGCTDSSMGTIVTVGTPPAAFITPSGRVAICQGSSTKLRTNSAAGLTYSWTRNGTVLTGAGNTDSTLNVMLAGIYTVTVSAGAGCSSTSAPDTVVINPKPATGVTLLTPAIICAGDTVRARAAGGSGNMYQWSVANAGLMLAQTDSNFVGATIASTAGISTYSFRVIITTATGCKDSSASVNVTINPLPAVNIINNGGLLDAGFYSSYQWYRNGVLLPGITGSLYTPGMNGTYTVRVTNANGCSNTSAPVTISGLGVAGNSLAQQGIRVYPNPAQDILKIDAPYAVSAVIKDIQGRSVAYTADATVISISQLNAGIYSITLYNVAGTSIGTQLIVKDSK